MTCSMYAQIGIRDARVIGDMNVGTQYVIVKNQYVVSGFNIEKYYDNYNKTQSLAMSVLNQIELANNKIVREIPYVVYTTPDEKIEFDYSANAFYNLIKNKGYTEEEIIFIQQLVKLTLEW